MEEKATKSKIVEDILQELESNKDIINQLESVISTLQKKRESSIRHLTEDKLRSLSFQELKELYSKTQLYLTEEQHGLFEQLAVRQLWRKFPEKKGLFLCPELLNVDISQECRLYIERLLTERSLKRAVYIKEEFFKNHKIDNDVLEKLCEKGILNKLYKLECENCDCDGFELLSDKDWRDAQIIHIQCMEHGCYGEYNINSAKDFKEHLVETYYKITKQPAIKFLLG